MAYDLSRRNFLRVAGLGGAGAALLGAETLLGQAGGEPPKTDMGLVELIKNTSRIFPQATSKAPGNIYSIDDGKGILTYRIGRTEKEQDTLVDILVKREEVIENGRKIYKDAQWGNRPVNKDEPWVNPPKAIVYDRNGQILYVVDTDLDNVANTFKGNTTTGEVDLKPTFTDNQVGDIQKRFEKNVNEAYMILQNYQSRYSGARPAAQTKSSVPNVPATR